MYILKVWTKFKRLTIVIFFFLFFFFSFFFLVYIFQVADTLSKKVLHETAEQLHRYFLDDPFKEMIPTKSLMLDKPPPTEEVRCS